MSARDLYELVDKRIEAALGGKPLNAVRGTVVEVNPVGFRLSARLDGQAEVTQDIGYDLALSPVVGDDILILRRADGFLLGVAILTRAEAVDPTPVEFIAAKAKQVTDVVSPAQFSYILIPLTQVEWDTDQMYVPPNAITVHYSGVYHITSRGPSAQVISGSGLFDWNAVVSRYPQGNTPWSTVMVLTNDLVPRSGDFWLDAGDVLRVNAYWGRNSGDVDIKFVANWVDLSITGYVVQTTTTVKGQAPAGCQAYNSTTQSINSGTFTALSLDSERWDTDAYHSNTVNNTRLTIPAGRSGQYRISGASHFTNGSASGGRFLRLVKNGVTFLRETGTSIVSAAHGFRGEVSTEVFLSAGDYIEMQGYQDSGGALAVGSTMDANLQTTLTLTALSTFPVTATEAPTRSIGATVIRETGLTLPAATGIPIPWARAQTDTDGFWSAALPERLTIPATAPAGLYALNLETFWPAGSTGTMTARWRKNGADVLSPDDYVSATGSSDNHVIVWASSGDYFDTIAYAASGGTLGGTSFFAKTVGSIAYLGSGSAAGTAVEGTEVSRSTAQTYTAGQTAAVSFDTGAIDQGGWWAVSPNPTRLTVKASGWYAYEGRGDFAAPTTAGRPMLMYLRKGGSTTVGQTDDTGGLAGYATNLGVAGQVYLSAGEYVELVAVNNDTASKDLSGTTLRLVRMANGAESTLEVAPIEDAPGVLAYNAGTQSVANGTATFFTFNSEDWDTHGFHSTSSNTDQFVVPAGMAGRYEVDCYASLGGSTAGIHVLGVQRNGVTLKEVDATAANSAAGVQITVKADLAVGDVIRCYAWQNSGTTLTAGHATTRQWMTHLSMVRLATSLQGEKGDPGADVFAEGTAFPTSPTVGQAFRRLDIRGGVLFRWNGVYWLSEQLFHTMSQARVFSTGVAATSHIDTQMFDDLGQGQGVWVERWHIHCYVTTANNSSNYWDFKSWALPGGAQTSRQTSLALSALATWTDVSVNVGYLTTDQGFHWYVVKVGSPGNLDFFGQATYRVRAV